MDIVVRTRYGQLCGRQSESIKTFLGVPFARPPIGENRFKAPQPPDGWSGIRPAQKLAKNPIQPFRTGDDSQFSEDCLYLNIWAPVSEQPQPVMVWLPGGAYAIGGAADPIYDGAFLARQTGCVIVTVTYRLNVFGYLDLSMFDPAFEKNLGLLDQIAALQWVRQNIAAFGGDPENVTIFGESAGGSAVLTLLCCPAAQALFHKAIAQSPAVEATYTADEQSEVSAKYIEYAGLAPEQVRDILQMSYTDLLAAGRRLSQYCDRRWPGHCTYRTVVDDIMLPGVPSQLAARAGGKPLIIGTNRHEATLFMRHYKRERLDRLYGDEGAFRNYPSEVRQMLYSVYPGFPAKSACIAVATDYMFTEPVLRFADDYSRNARVFVYLLDYYSPLLGLSRLKTMHSADVFILFDHEQSIGKIVYGGAKDTVRAIGDRMRSYWSAFARTGQPLVPELTKWPAYTAKAAQTMIISRIDQTLVHPHQTRRGVWQPITRL